MSSKIFYFSSTGNSLYVSKEIENSLENCELISIPKALKEGKLEYEADVIGFVFPLHSFSLPILVREFISKIVIKNNPYIFAVQVTGGGHSDNSFAEINEFLKARNRINNHAEVKYISNYTRMGLNPTEERTIKAIEANEELLSNFIVSLKNREIKNKDFKKGFSNLMNKAWRELYKNKDKSFNVNDSCINCSICERICPTDNIKMVNERPTWNGKCVDCMACINACPKKAINLGKSTISKNRYRNPYIKIEELI
ncbi:EFR1 family ferrodoxin [Clostridium paridis]|uniref:Ferredoxin n=1 Tax=Clostridium paridis TaxID=2803863 RepID=A0A937FK60_9CLOT|nr:EFR1 family ferrodoxin [Clostridium paridis]MBL4934097.1 EFR1 family ferrodoxin [Clostridium paridis]